MERWIFAARSTRPRSSSGRCGCCAARWSWSASPRSRTTSRAAAGPTGGSSACAASPAGSRSTWPGTPGRSLGASARWRAPQPSGRELKTANPSGFRAETAAECRNQVHSARKRAFLARGRHPDLLLQLLLQDLPGRPLRQRLQEADRARVLVGGHPLLGIGDQLLLGDRLACLDGHDGRDLFAQPFVGDADDGRLLNRRVRVEDLFDLPRVDVEAAADDQLLLAVDDEEEAFLVLVAHVAGMEPAALERLGRGLRLLVVALHDVVAADHDLADVVLAARQGLVVLVEDLHLDAPDALPDGAEAALLEALV